MPTHDHLEDATPLALGAVRWLATPAGRDALAAWAADAADPLALGVLDRVKTNPVRQVYRLVADGREFFLKRFDESSLARRTKRLFRGPAARVEWDHARAARAAGVPTPQPVAAGVARGCSFLLTASCRPAANLDDCLNAAGWSDDLGDALADLLARCLRAGLIHDDLHAGNVLIRAAEPGAPPTLWLLDLQKVRLGNQPASPRSLVAMFAALRAWTAPAQRRRLLARTLQLAQVADEAGTWFDALERAGDAHLARLARGRDRDILGCGRYFSPIRVGDWRGHVFLQARRARPDRIDTPLSRLAFTVEQWRAALASPETLAEQSTRVFKHLGASTVVLRELTVGERTLTVCVKYVPARLTLRTIARVFRDRARRAFRLGHQLLGRSIDTALPLACLSRRVGLLAREMVLVTEAVTDSKHVKRFVLDVLPTLSPREQTRARQSVARQIGGYVAAMGSMGWVHRDLKAPNVLVQWTGGRARVVLIDLDGVRRMPWARLRPLVRLNAGLSQVPGVTRADRLRVLHAMLSGRGELRHAWRKIARQTRARLDATD